MLCAAGDYIVNRCVVIKSSFVCARVISGRERASLYKLRAQIENLPDVVHWVHEILHILQHSTRKNKEFFSFDRFIILEIISNL